MDDHLKQGSGIPRQFLTGVLLLLLAGAVAVITLMWIRSHRAVPGTNRVYQGTTLDRPSQDFQLVDQHGATVALSDLRGKVVVLTFLDTQCEDVCPLTAAHLLRTYRSLGKRRDSVVFLGVNVNVKAGTITDVAEATKKWQLNQVPTWHFLTGVPKELERTWKAYFIQVEPSPKEGGEILHTPGVYLIDKTGRQHWYISLPPEQTDSQGLALSDLLEKRIRELL